MMGHPLDRGKAAEAAAADFLSQRGYRIIVRNWRHQHLEVDIIAYHGDILVFVEVKMRSSAAFGMPYEAVSLAKQEKLARAANHYIEQHNHQGEIRFDVVSILQINPTSPNIRLIQDAFWPE